VLANIALIFGVSAVVWTGQNRAESTTTSLSNVISNSGTKTASAPLDEISSADIAANIANAAGLTEASSVSEQADSYNIELASAPVEESVIVKPQLVAGADKSVKDISSYTAVSGDTVTSVAAKFGVTSDSIRWSNGLNSNTIPAGKVLYIPPKNGIVYKVGANDTIDSIAAKYSANKEQLIAFNDIELTGLKAGEVILIPDGVKPAEAASYSRTGSSSGVTVSAISFSAKYGNNTYARGYCTWYAASRVNVPNNWGNARTWDNYARISGWNVTSTPVVGAIFQTDAGWAGHVGIVDAVSPDGSMILATDMNGWAGYGRVGSKWVSASSYKYIYR
jgi:N-acetylmuramoyl-L-alanine amidase